MAAPKGNQDWMLRSKHGRDKLFASSELLWDAACEYFQWCDDNPWVRTETTTKQVKTKVKVKGKEGEEDTIVPISDVKEIPTARPYTLEGFCLYCEASRSWWSEFKKAGHEGFLEVTTRIDQIIYKQKFEGAAVGAFNANIIARDLGLVDKKDIDATLKGDNTWNVNILKPEGKG